MAIFIQLPIAIKDGYQVQSRKTKKILFLKVQFLTLPLSCKTLYKKLKDAGIKINGNPVTTRLMPELKTENFTLISETISPPLSAIIDVLNHKSVNLYAEHLIKEPGKSI